MLYRRICFIVMCCVVCIAVGCAGNATSEVADDLLVRARQDVELGRAALLDVREVREWNESHLQVAQLVPTSVLRDEAQRELALEVLDTSVPVYLHCKKGGRAKACATLLRRAGYDAVPLIVDYEKLIAAGFAVSRQ